MRILISVLSLLYLFLFKINWVKFFRLKNKKSDNIIWLYQDYPKSFLKYFFGGYFVSDFSFVYACIQQERSFRLCFGKLPEPVSGKNILYPVSQRFNKNKEEDYTRPLIREISRLEALGNRMYPSAAEAMYWENKIYMHEQFHKLGIPQPATAFITEGQDAAVVLKDLSYPLLIKEAHSRHSQGIYKVNSAEEAIGIITKRRKERVTDFLVQDLVDMHRDMRVILTGDEIVLHYWRINLAENWKPTSTSHGSMVDFESFPEKWRSTIMDSFKKLQITTGGFDVCFEHDDINTPPLFLEVSSSYQPNPRPTGKNATIPYYAYKKKIVTANPYFKAAIDIAYALRAKEINCFFNKPAHKN